MKWAEDLIRRALRDGNVASVVNVAKADGASTSVHRHQRIVQRDGETSVTNETHVHHEGDAPDDREI